MNFYEALRNLVATGKIGDYIFPVGYDGKVILAEKNSQYYKIKKEGIVENLNDFEWKIKWAPSYNTRRQRDNTYNTEPTSAYYS